MSIGEKQAWQTIVMMRRNDLRHMRDTVLTRTGYGFFGVADRREAIV
jgi:hypothetical protein